MISLTNAIKLNKARFDEELSELNQDKKQFEEESKKVS